MKLTQKPKITLLYDIEDWAFHNVVRNISAVTHGFDYSLHNKASWFAAPLASEIVFNSDLIVFMWRFDVTAFLKSLSDAAWDHLLGPDGPALVTIIYDHLHQSPDAISKMGDPYPVCDLVCAASDRLRHIYNGTPHLPTVFSTLPDGVNLERYCPPDIPRDLSAPLAIGWVGNSAWGQKIGKDLKGRHGIFDVAMDILRERGRAFETRIADRAETRIPYDEMPGFYRSLDVLVCTSAIEGTPNPVLEAAASGCAVVSTDVGIVPQVLGRKQSEFIVTERTAEAFADALERLIADRGLHCDLCAENINRRETMSWASRAPMWTEMFHEALIRRRDPSRTTKQRLAQFRAEA